MESALLSLPAFLIYSFILIYPMLSLFRLSMYKWNGIPNSPMEWVGFSNYISFFKELQRQHYHISWYVCFVSHDISSCDIGPGSFADD